MIVIPTGAVVIIAMLAMLAFFAFIFWLVFREGGDR